MKLHAVIFRYALALALLYFGAFKFTAAEASGIQPLVANSPLFGWLYSVGSLQAVSNAIGVAEIALGLLVASGRFLPRFSQAGGLGAAGLFAVTLTFLFTTPGAWVSVPGFPLPVTSLVGAFLIKDVFLLGASLWSAADSMQVAR